MNLLRYQPDIFREAEMSAGARLNLAEVEHLDEAFANPEARPTLARPLAGLSLGALGELVCLGAAWSARGRHDEVAALRHWATYHGPLRRAWQALRAPEKIQNATLDQSSFGVWPAPTRSDLFQQPWQLFLEGFSEGLKRNGFPSQLAHALRGAFGEMADNVVSHSTPDGKSPAPGIVAFHMQPGWMAYAVADTGRGVLASLITAPRWAHLSSSADALRSAVTERATCRPGEETGAGYRTVIQALSERNGYLRFRSEDAKLELRGTPTTLAPTGGPVPRLPGLQLVVHCALDGVTPGERWLPGE